MVSIVTYEHKHTFRKFIFCTNYHLAQGNYFEIDIPLSICAKKTVRLHTLGYVIGTHTCSRQNIPGRRSNKHTGDVVGTQKNLCKITNKIVPRRFNTEVNESEIQSSNLEQIQQAVNEDQDLVFDALVAADYIDEINTSSNEGQQTA